MDGSTDGIGECDPGKKCYLKYHKHYTKMFGMVFGTSLYSNLQKKVELEENVGQFKRLR